jgi:predicted ester cyclase
MTETLICRYYQCFNERRFAEAAALFAEDAVLERIPARPERGGTGYVRFATAWIAAFPNAKFSVQRVEQRGETICEVYLLATGTHRGLLDFGVHRFEPTEAEAVLHVRELLDIRDGKITASVMSVDLNDVVAQLATVDYDELVRRLERIRALSDALVQAGRDASRQREVVGRLGPEVDAARRALRPHFHR